MPIRFAQESDIHAMLAIYGPYVEHTTHSFEYTVPSEAEFLIRFREHTAQFPWLIWEEEVQVLGYAYAGAPWGRPGFQWSAEASIYLAPEAQGRGIGRALYAGLEQILTAQGYRMLYAIITTENTASIAFHEAVGYRYRADFPGCGYKHGRWLGVTYMEKELNPPENAPKTPEKWTKIC